MTTLTTLTILSNPTKLTNRTTLTISTDQKNYQEDKRRIRMAYFVLFSQQQAAWILFLVLSVHKNIISYQKTVACTFGQVTAGSQAKIDLAIKLGADKGVIIIIIINTFTFSSSLLPPTPSSTAVSSYKGLPFILLVKFHLTKSQSGN